MVNDEYLLISTSGFQKINVSIIKAFDRKKVGSFIYAQIQARGDHMVKAVFRRSDTIEMLESVKRQDFTG